jgi:hypothetical protein
MQKPIPTDIVTIKDLPDSKYSVGDLFLVIGYQQVYQGEELIVLLDPYKVYVMTDKKNVYDIQENLQISDLLWSKQESDTS